ncbi:cell division ATPase MinD [Haladaptatus cibarius]|uniref:cell division ATPase MinD n=1 Tax=Haladaptatus cibarius TaxID=453847 RepID=UPI000679E7B6|nr:cell division ATPase MinD [Haladaptatus cibarius]
MTGTVYAVASGKGGVGKTTTAINLGAMLASAEHEVIVVDTDLGMANVEGYLDFEPTNSTLHEVLAGEATVEDSIYEAPGDIHVLPSSTDIHAFAQSQTAKLQQVVAQLREEYEYVLLDTGAGISYDTILPLSLSDGVLLVTTPDVAAVRDTAKTAELTVRVEGTVRGAVLTHRSNDILNADDVEGTLDTDVLTVVPDDETVPMGIDAGRPLAMFAPTSPAATAYRELADILTGETDTPELSGEPNSAKSSESMFEDEDSAQSDGRAERKDTDPVESERPDSPSTGPDSSPTAEQGDPGPNSDSAPGTDPVHDLIDRRVIKTGDQTEDGEPTVEAVPDDGSATAELSSESDDEPAFEKSFDELDEAPDDELQAPVTEDTDGEDDVANGNQGNDFNTVLADSTEDPEKASQQSADESNPTVTGPDSTVNDSEPIATESEPTPDESKSTPDESIPTAGNADSNADISDEAPEDSSNLPDEIVEAEPENEEDIDAVPFQDEPVRPHLNDEDEADSEEEDEEKNGLFGRIGSLFR